jgi:hypothetical protein
MTDDDEITNEIGERERAFIKGHRETERRLLESPRWSQEDVDDLRTAVEGYEDFAICVIDELRWDQRDEE